MLAVHLHDGVGTSPVGPTHWPRVRWACGVCAKCFFFARLALRACLTCPGVLRCSRHDSPVLALACPRDAWFGGSAGRCRVVDGEVGMSTMYTHTPACARVSQRQLSMYRVWKRTSSTIVSSLACLLTALPPTYVRLCVLGLVFGFIVLVRLSSGWRSQCTRFSCGLDLMCCVPALLPSLLRPQLFPLLLSLH